jgi:hypothetical protein
MSLVVPYDRSSLIGEVHKRARVVSESYEDGGVHYELKLSAIEAARIQRLMESGR